MVKIKDLEDVLYNVTGDIQLIITEHMSLASYERTNVISGVIAKIDLIPNEEDDNIAIIEFTFENGTVIYEDLNMLNLEINKDLYLSDGIISLVDYNIKKEIHIQE